jgi:hypothetical protein
MRCVPQPLQKPRSKPSQIWRPDNRFRCKQCVSSWVRFVKAYSNMLIDQVQVSKSFLWQDKVYSKMGKVTINHRVRGSSPRWGAKKQGPAMMQGLFVSGGSAAPGLDFDFKLGQAWRYRGAPTNKGRPEGRPRCTIEPADQPRSLMPWISAATTFWASPYTMRVLSAKNSAFSMPAKPTPLPRLITCTFLA